MRTILVIDDDEICRQPVCVWLTREGWNVLEASDGDIGLSLAIQHRPDVILCDLLMPGVNGYQVCRAVRDQLELRHTRIIVVTGRDYAADRKSAEEAGADDYLVKPLAFDNLAKALGRIAPSITTEPRIGSGVAGPMIPTEGTLIKFWGVRGSIPAPGPATVEFGGNTSCVEVRTGGRLIIFDAGSGIRPLGLSLLKESKGAPMEIVLLLTHTHWDHIQGFPFFVPAYDARNRLHILGYEGAKAGLANTLAGQMESPYFPVALDEMPGNIEIEELKSMHFNIGPLKVEACFTNHPGVCVAYKLYTDDGTVVYMPDNETKKGGVSATSGVLEPDPSEAAIAQFIRGVDVVIMDSQYTAAEYQTHINWGHGCVDEVVRLAASSNVKHLYLFHHDPAHDDDCISRMLDHALDLVKDIGSPMRVSAAREEEEIQMQVPQPAGHQSDKK